MNEHWFVEFHQFARVGFVTSESENEPYVECGSVGECQLSWAQLSRPAPRCIDRRSARHGVNTCRYMRCLVDIKLKQSKIGIAMSKSCDQWSYHALVLFTVMVHSMHLPMQNTMHGVYVSIAQGVSDDAPSSNWNKVIELYIFIHVTSEATML